MEERGGMNMVLIIVIVIVALLVIYGIATFNGLVKLRNKAQAAWAQVDVVLKRRADLIPNLVETVKGYASHESKTLTEVMNARNRYTKATTAEDKIESSNMLTQALGHLFAVAEAYPDLKANTDFLELQKQLQETEDKIQYARQFYNDDVTQYKNKCEMFPSNIIAGIGGFKAMPFYEIDEASREAPKVSF